jgi:nucleotide-binding universal stress UspA family protein
MKVIVGVDGSSNSFAAVAFIGRLISPQQDKLILFFATPAMSFDDERLDVAVEDRARSALSRNILDAALERLPEEWRTRAERMDSTGSPGNELVGAAQESGADLIVVGYRGTSSIVEQFLLGSVTRKVLHSAKVSVLVVKGSDESEAQTKATSPLRTLVAYDASHGADAMAGMLKRFTWPAGAEGRVLTVVRPMFLADLPDWVMHQPRDPDVAAMAEEWSKEHQQNLAAARQELERFRGMLPACFARGEAIVAEGRPAEQIITTARDSDVELIVLGSRESGRLERLLVGSTSEQVLASATCSVLVVR